MQIIESDKAWTKFLEAKLITSPLHTRIITEGALIGSIANHQFNDNLIIVSDDVPQFKVLDHALCWIHAERLTNKLIGFSDEHKNL